MKGVADRALRADAWLFAALTALAFAYVVARAAFVPLVHDEANSFFHYVHSGSWMPFHSKWDAADHVLVMAIGNVCNALFGPAPMSLRAFAVASFLLFASCAWFLGLRIRDRVVRWCCWAAVLAMPFVLEFFSLFRGYGPSFALLLLAVLALLDFLGTGRTRSVLLASIAMGAGVMANLSLLPLWAVVMAVLIVRFGHGSEGYSAKLGRALALLVGLSPGLWMVAFAMGLSERGLLYYGSDRGLLLGSFASLRERLVPTFSDTAGLLLCIGVATLLLLAVVDVVRRRAVRAHAMLVVMCALLFLELAGRVVLGEAFGMLYPKDRAILHIFPLLVFAVAAALDVLVQHRSPLRWAALPLLSLPLYTLFDANLYRTIQWPEESISDAIYRTVGERQAASDRGLLIAGASPLGVIWDHQLLSGNLDFPLIQPAQEPLLWADLVLADARKPELWQKDFDIVLGPDDSGQYLLEPKQPMQHRSLLDTLVVVPTTSNEFVELWVSELVVEPGSKLIVELGAVLDASIAAPGECMLVVQVGRPGADHGFYRSVPLHHLRSRHEDRNVRITVGVDHCPQSDERLSVYIWNLAGREIALGGGRLRIHEVRSVMGGE